MADTPRISYEKVQEISNFVISRLPDKPKLGIICGSGIGNIVNQLENTIDIQYSEIPDFPECTVPGHVSMLTYGICSGVPTICFRGRFHIYEGYSLDQIVLPVRIMKLIDVKLVIITNAAGGINQGYAVGDIMLFKDHINFVGFSGNNPIKCADSRWGRTFPSISYDKNIRNKAKDALANCGLQVHDGVYVCLGGPNYETIAETNMMKLCGADAVGMSTAHEALAAMHCGLKVLAFSIITNLAITDYDSEVKCIQDDVVAECIKLEKPLQSFLENFVQSLDVEISDEYSGTQVETLPVIVPDDPTELLPEERTVQSSDGIQEEALPVLVPEEPMELLPEEPTVQPSDGQADALPVTVPEESTELLPKEPTEQPSDGVQEEALPVTVPEELPKEPTEQPSESVQVEALKQSSQGPLMRSSPEAQKPKKKCCVCKNKERVPQDLIAARSSTHSKNKERVPQDLIATRSSTIERKNRSATIPSEQSSQGPLKQPSDGVQVEDLTSTSETMKQPPEGVQVEDLTSTFETLKQSSQGPLKRSSPEAQKPKTKCCVCKNKERVSQDLIAARSSTHSKNKERVPQDLIATRSSTIERKNRSATIPSEQSSQGPLKQAPEGVQVEDLTSTFETVKQSSQGPIKQLSQDAQKPKKKCCECKNKEREP